MNAAISGFLAAAWLLTACCSPIGSLVWVDLWAGGEAAGALELSGG